MSILNSLSFIEPDTLQEARVEYGWLKGDEATQVSFRCRANRAESCGRTVFVEGELMSISPPTPVSLTVGDAVDRLGPPDYYSCLELPGEVGRSNLSLYWRQKGAIASSIERGSCSRFNGGISSWTRVTNLEYAVGERFDFCLPDCEQYEPWRGLGDS
jgi:hypothetical protein